MVLLQRTASNKAEIGKILSQDKDKLEIELFLKNQQSFVSAGKRIYVNIGSCYPGGFQLTRGGHLPSNIKDRLKRENVSL